MANLASKNGNEYHVLDFSNLNDRGLAPLKKSVERTGVKIAKLSQPSAARRKDGVLLRTVSITMMDEQEVTLQVNDSGDVSAINLNKKPLPYTGAKNLNELAKIIADGVKSSAPSFAKQLVRKLAKASRDDEAGEKKPVIKSNVQRLAEQKNRVEAAKQQIAMAKSQYAEREASAVVLRNEADDLNTKVKAERTINKKLQAELERLKKGINDE